LAVNVLTWHNDLSRDGLNSNEVTLTPSNVGSGTFGELFSYPVTGQVYAQPLYVSNLAIPGKGTHNVIFVVTQNNDVYAFDANSNTGSGGLLWHVNLGPAAATPNNFFANRYGAYHDINPQVGITSTPVIDLSTNTMYLDAFTNDTPGQNVYSHHIHALDITTGADKLTPMLVQASVNGNGVEGNGTTITFVAEQQLQRPAMTLLNGTLYVTYGSYADTDPYHGWILGFNPTNLHLISVFNDTPNLLSPPGNNAGEGGFWMSGSGPASDGTNLFLLSGNGDFNAAIGDYGDTVLKVSPDTSTQTNPNINGYGLKVGDYFTPYNQANLASGDTDLGSGGGIVLPDQPGPYPHEYIGSGKQGVIYVINRDSMSGYSSSAPNPPDHVIQEVSLGHGNWDSPAYFNETIYYHAVGDVLKAYTLSNGLLSAAPAAQSTIAYPTSYGATPSVSSNGTANGIVWDVEFDSSHEVLRAYDATTLTELYDTNQFATRDQLGAGVKFITPTIADGEVFVGSTGAVTVYGLLAPPTSPPIAPTNLTAAAISATQITLTWADSSNSQSDAQAGFKIERSTDGVNFAQIAVAGASAVSYTDMNLSPSTKYYYRIRATNVVGDSAYIGPVSATTPAVTGAIDVYHFDAGSGTTAVDSVGTNTGTLTGTTKPAWVTPGKIGAAALSFSGNGTYNQAVGSQSAVTLANDLSPILGGTSSLDAWFKTTQLGNNTHWQAPAITGVEQAGAGNDINWGTLNASGQIGIYVGDSGGIYSTNAVNNGQWHNIAVTRNATTGQVQLYIDGVLNGSGTFDTGNKTSKFSVIGALADVANDGVTPTGDNYFNGQLDEVRIYNQVLSATDVQGLALIPGAPTLTTATAASGSVVHLAWTTPSSFTQSIEVDRKTGASGTFSAVATLGGGVTVFDDQNLTAGTQYTYEIKAIDLAGSSAPSNQLTVTPPVPTIVGNYVFYNNSVFDGFNGSSNVTDDNAIATNKQALLPGQTATFQNVTGSAKGINGVMIDVANLDTVPTVDNFSFAVGNDSNPSAWPAPPDPTYVNIYPGRGPGGSTQITIIWDDNAIQNEWLQVTMLADQVTGLTAPDVFYFGNLVGATGASNTSTNVVVGPADVASIIADPHSPLSKAPVTDVNDLNRDGQVNANDAILARDNAGNTLPLITAPASGGAAPAVGISSPASESLSPALDSSPSSAPTSTTAGSAIVSAALVLPMPSSSPAPAVKTDSASSSTSCSSQISADEPPPQSRLGRQAIMAAWDSLDDANHGTAWWNSDRIADAGNDASTSFAAAWLDELLTALSVGRPHWRG
jgi:hypothetical protein